MNEMFNVLNPVFDFLGMAGEDNQRWILQIHCVGTFECYVIVDLNNDHTFNITLEDMCGSCLSLVDQHLTLDETTKRVINFSEVIYFYDSAVTEYSADSTELLKTLESKIQSRTVQYKGPYNNTKAEELNTLVDRAKAEAELNGVML
jgi:hypothetical protein